MRGIIAKKGFIEISFAWLFGIIAGAVILSLAIFAATRILNTGQTATGAETQNQIAVLLNPLETSFQSGEVTSIILPTETRIYNECDDKHGIFGNQYISISQQSFGGWTQQTNPASFENKYIFSESAPEGKQFFLFSKPFELPFKIADIIYMTSSLKQYCFANDVPDAISSELSSLNETNILLETESSECPSTSIKVCFGTEKCNIKVDYNSGTVDTKEGRMVFSDDALMYGAIFSNKTVYDCQLKRLMERATELSSLYLEKDRTISASGCSSGLDFDLSIFSSLSNSFNNSGDIVNLAAAAIDMKNKNDETTCKLW